MKTYTVTYWMTHSLIQKDGLVETKVQVCRRVTQKNVTDPTAKGLLGPFAHQFCNFESIVEDSPVVPQVTWEMVTTSGMFSAD